MSEGSVKVNQWVFTVAQLHADTWAVLMGWGPDVVSSWLETPSQVVLSMQNVTPLDGQSLRLDST